MYICYQVREVVMFIVSIYILTSALLVMAVVMAVVAIPRTDPRLQGYIISRRLLAVSYVALAVYCIFKGHLQLELFLPVFLFISNLQACLLAFSHINLINPQRVTVKYVLLHFLPMCVCLTAYCIVRIFAPHTPLTEYAAYINSFGTPEVMARTFWMIQYVALYTYIIILFVREYRRWKVVAADFFADDTFINIRHIAISMVIILCIGLVSMGITLSLNPTTSSVLNITIMLLYIVLGILFLRYPQLFLEMKPVLYDDDLIRDDISAPDAQRWQRMRKEIIDSRLYLQPGITLSQIARKVNVCRTTLSNTINRQENKNFNTFINNLRIESAQQIMRQYPDKSLLEIALAVGYTEQSNFTAHFKQYAGITPAEWRKRKL